VDQKQINFFKEILLAWREELLGQANGTVSSLSGMDPQLADLADQAAFEEVRSYLLRMRDRESKLIKKINNALDRIEDGTYGICDRCGEEISIGRLKARPVASFCIDCKTFMEREEAILGS
jgi:DnaK suppressor protein